MGRQCQIWWLGPRQPLICTGQSRKALCLLSCSHVTRSFDAATERYWHRDTDRLCAEGTELELALVSDNRVGLFGGRCGEGASAAWERTAHGMCGPLHAGLAVIVARKASLRAPVPFGARCVCHTLADGWAVATTIYGWQVPRVLGRAIWEGYLGGLFGNRSN